MSSRLSPARLRQSVFLKLLLVFVAAALAVVAILRVFQRDFLSNDTRRQHRGENFSEYAGYLTESLGYPPAPARVAELGERLHLKIRVQSPALNLASSPDVPAIETVESRMQIRSNSYGSRAARYLDYTVMLVDGPNQSRYLYLMEGENALEGHSELLIGLAASLLLILLLSYLSLRYVLSPLKSLEKGMREVAAGNLEARLETDRQDELGRMVKSFNRMTSQIKQMIRAKQQLLLDVSHEFRSPLTRIKVAVELPGPAAAESIKRSVRDLEAMITELLETARLEDDARGGLRREKVDLNEFLPDLLTRYERDRPGVRLLDDAAATGFGSESAPSLFAEIDPMRMGIAIHNLLDNAIKYSAHQDRPVEISIRRARTSPAKQPNGETPARAGGVTIQVRDFGRGIPPTEQALIFEPFYRIDHSRTKGPAGGGYGLGLSLCHKIVVAHGGAIRVESDVGQPTVFSIDLP